MEHNQFSLTSLLIVTILSFIVPIVIKKIKRIHIPVVVGEIIIGMIIGKSGFDIIVMDENLQFIEFFGLAYLMFIAGLEIDFDVFLRKNQTADKKGILNNPLFLSVIILSITLMLAYLASLILGKYNLIRDPLLMSLIIAATSLGIVVPTLKEKKLTGTLFGQFIITGAVLADFVTMLLISVAISLFKGGLSLEIFLVTGLLFLVFVLYRLSERFRGNLLFKELAHGTTQIGIRGSFAVMLLFLVLSQSIGAEMILGSFLAGTVVSLVSQKQREEIHHKLDAIGFGFLIPVFFILVGVNFDISVLFNNPKGLLLVPVLFGIVYIVKGIPVLLLKFIFPWKQVIAGAVLLTSKLSLTIAAAAIGLQIGAISPEVSAAILLVSIITSIVSPIMFGKMIPVKEENEEEKFVIIIGSTKQTILLARRLIKLGSPVLLIESKREKAEDLTLSGIEIIWGDAMNIHLLEELALQDARSIVIATGSDEINYEVAKNITYHFKTKEVITLLNDPAIIEKAQTDSQIRVVNPQLATVNLLENMICHPVASSMFEHKFDLHMEEVEVVNPLITGKKLRDISLPGDVLIFSVYRNGETILPHGDTKFESGDILLVLGTNYNVEEFVRFALNR